MGLKTRLQLSTMMFLQYFIWGTWYVTLNTYLGETLGFTATQIGLCYGTFAIACMISPFFVGSNRRQVFCHGKSAGFHAHPGCCLACTLPPGPPPSRSFTRPCLLYTLTYAPTMALSNSLSFHQMDNPGKQFPGVRVLGTIGWIVANNVIGWLGYTLTVEQLYVGAAASLMLGLYSFTLPHVPPKKEKKASVKELIGLDALSLFKIRAFATIMIASVLIFIPVSFYFGFTASFMSDIGIDPDIIPNRISMGQMAEILFILILPFFITRFGVKKVLFIGITAWMIRFLLFANGNAEGGVWMIYTAIILHGICYDFFVVTGQIFVDEKAPDHLKSSAQGLITFATYGLGMLIGTWFAGRTIDSGLPWVEWPTGTRSGMCPPLLLP